MMLCLPSPSAIFFHISKGKPCQSASLACQEEARNTIFAGTNPWCTAWKGAQRSWCFEQVIQMPPKPVSWAHSKSPPPRHLFPPASQHKRHPQSMCRAQCGKKIWFFPEKRILAIWRPPWQIIVCLWNVPHLCKQEQIENARNFNTLSGLQLPTHTRLLWFTSSQSDLNPHLAETDFAEVHSGQEGAAETPTKSVKSSQPYETPHKHPPDNLDMGNKILQYCYGHLFPAVFWNAFFHKAPAVSDTSEWLQHPKDVRGVLNYAKPSLGKMISTQHYL